VLRNSNFLTPSGSRG